MLWILTGNSACGYDGLLYVIEAETELEVYEQVAFRRDDVNYVSIHRTVEKPHEPKSVAGVLDDRDEFTDFGPVDVLLHKNAKAIPSWEDVFEGQEFPGWVCYVAPLVVGMNHSDAVQW